MKDKKHHTIAAEAPCYITLTVVDGYPLFLDEHIRHLLFKTLQTLTLTDIDVFAFVIMPNHLHLVAQGDEIEAKIYDIKRLSATAIIDYLLNDQKHRIIEHLRELTGKNISHEPNRIWSKNIPITPINEPYYLQKYVLHVHQNPVRAGIVSHPERWRWSSAGIYTGNPEPIHLSEFNHIYHN